MANKQTRYSRDEVVAALTSFYEFLAGLHLPSSAIKYPPPGGWPNLTPEYLAFMKKNDTVIDLLQHMPYIRDDGEDDEYQIYDKTMAVDYEGKAFRKMATFKNPTPDVADPIEEVTTLPSHVVTLAKPAGGVNGYYFFLDTERGTISICDFQDGAEFNELSQVIDEDSTETWREHATYSAQGFFDMVKDQFRSLEVIPTKSTEVLMVSRCSEGAMDPLKEIYRAHGWPSENYRKEECMTKVREAWREISGY